jgi:16S rRNA (guanine527-N7)-methyltransferase
MQRLVGAADAEWIVIHVILDSLLFLRVLPADVRRVLDFGSGAGVPGVPLKIVRRDLEVVLLEARRRRASFLGEVVRQLDLRGSTVVAERAETAVQRLGSTADAVVMRCAGPCDDVLPLALMFVRPGGRVVLSGSPDVQPGAGREVVEVTEGEAEEPRRFVVVTKPS